MNRTTARLSSAGALGTLLVLAAAGPAQAATGPAVSTYTFTAGRLAGSAAALIALAGVVIGALAVARPAAGGRRAIIALAGGLLGLAGGALVVALAKGGPGTGYGIVGGFVALALGLAATILGRLGLARSRRG